MATSVSGSQITFSDLTTQNTAASGFGFHNRLINGAMQVWQRGTSFTTTTGSYMADRWKAAYSGYTASQSTDVPSGLPTKYSLDLIYPSGNYGDFRQLIESVNCTDLVGATVTVSFYVKVVSGTSNVWTQLQYANAVDNFNTVTNIGTVTITPSSSWARYSVTFTNLPSGVSNGLMVQFYTDSVTSMQIRYTGFQLEKGPTVTTFDTRPYGTELALCQRYYFRYKAQATGDVFGWGDCGSSTVAYINIPFPVTMRVAPSALEQSGTASDYRVGSGSVLGTCTAVPTFTSATTGLIQITTTVGSGLTNGFAARVVANTGTNAYLGWNAEL